MKMGIIFWTVLIFTGMVSSASAFDQKDVEKLLTTGHCFKCDLKGADLRGKLHAPENSEYIYIVESDLTNANLHGLSMPNLRANDAILSNADLSETDLQGGLFYKANLSGANLSGANLKHFKAEDADLSGANLSGAYLYKAYLNKANLTGANLSGANLTKSSMEGANLQDANLEGAIFDRVELWNANLQGANKEKADMSKAIFNKVLHLDKSE